MADKRKGYDSLSRSQKYRRLQNIIKGLETPNDNLTNVDHRDLTQSSDLLCSSDSVSPNTKGLQPLSNSSDNSFHYLSSSNSSAITANMGLQQRNIDSSDSQDSTSIYSSSSASLEPPFLLETSDSPHHVLHGVDDDKVCDCGEVFVDALRSWLHTEKSVPHMAVSRLLKSLHEKFNTIPSTVSTLMKKVNDRFKAPVFRLMEEGEYCHFDWIGCLMRQLENLLVFQPNLSITVNIDGIPL